MKKVLAILLTAAMVMAMGLTAFAATQTETYSGTGASTDGSITISNATKNQEYTIYKVFDANPSGTEGLVAYTANKTVRDWLSTDSAAQELFKFTEVVANTTYNVEKKSDSVTDAQIINFFKGLVTEEDGTTTVDRNLTSLKVAETTATETNVKFDKVPYGYYVVQSSLGAVVSVDTTNKAVTIVDKNQDGPSWNIDDQGTGKAFTDENKTVVTESNNGTTVTSTVNSANYGDTLHYVIGINTTNYDGDEQITDYYVKDTLAAGLQYDKTKVEVYVGETKLESSAYTLTWGTGTDNGFEITIPWVNETASKFDSPNTIKVYYDATVLDTAALAGEGNKNTANFTYKTTSDEEKKPYDETKEKGTTTYVYALGILKVATNKDKAVTDTVLSGATFTLKDNDGNAVNVVEETAGSGTYKLDTATTGTKSNVVVSPTSGLITVKGLKAGTYKLTETKAPAGYNLVSGDIEVEASVAQTSTYTTTITTHYDGDGHVVSETTDGGVDTTKTASVNVVPVTVENRAGGELPETVGMGTTIFYVAGMMLVIGAGVIMITRRRMEGNF